MRLSRRGLFGGFLGAAVAAKIAPVQAASPVQPSPVKPIAKFPRGTVMPRYHVVSDPGHTHFPMASHGYTQAVAVLEYDIFDGSAFVPLNSSAGQQVVRELS